MSFKQNFNNNNDVDNSFDEKEWGCSSEEDNYMEDEFTSDNWIYDEIQRHDIEDSRLYVSGKVTTSLPAPRPLVLRSSKTLAKFDTIKAHDNNVIVNDEYDDTVKTKLTWLKVKPIVIDYDCDDTDDDEDVNNHSLKSLSDDDYPSLSSEIFKKPVKKEVIKPQPVIKQTSGEGWRTVTGKKKKLDDEEPISFQFTKPCATWISGTKCNRKGCTYAHSEKDLKITECNFKNCNMVDEKDGYFSNKSADRTCGKIHSYESKDNFLERLGIKKVVAKIQHKIPDELNYALSLLPVDKYIEFEGIKYFGKLSGSGVTKKSIEPKKQEKTQMCRSIKEKTKCPHKNNCRYAHSFNELVVAVCGFKEKCRGIKLDPRGNNYTNATNGKVCCYRHPGETKENYRKRVSL